MKYLNIREEELKNRVGQDFFDKFDCTEIIRDIDFVVKVKRAADAISFGDEYLLWAETKAAHAGCVAEKTVVASVCRAACVAAI